MKAIVAVDINWGIGYEGNLLERIPNDMKFFKEKTLSRIVVMGRETFESLPGQQPLKERVNIVLTTKEKYEDKDVIVCASLEELLLKLKEYLNKDIYIIGGEAVYTQLLPYCSEVYVTKILNTYKADKYFPNLDKKENWDQVNESETYYYKDIPYTFTTYSNGDVKKFE